MDESPTTRSKVSRLLDTKSSRSVMPGLVTDAATPQPSRCPFSTLAAGAAGPPAPAPMVRYHTLRLSDERVITKRTPRKLKIDKLPCLFFRHSR